jgi:Demerecviridae HNH endonuclease
MVSTYAKTDLTPDYVKSLFNYDPTAGDLTWKNGRVAGWLEKNGQRRIGIDGSTYVAQRIIWVIVKGEWPPHDVDHRNLDKSDNRWDNLRAATTGQNARNRRRPKSNSSGFKGVSLHSQSGKWWARIMIDRKSVSLGLHNTRESAHEAYRKAAAELHGDFARHN